MTAFTAPTISIPFRLPRRPEVRAMLNRPSVFITAILAGLVAFLALLSAVVYLVATNHPTDAVTGLLGGSLLVLVINLRGQIRDLHTKVDQTTGSGS